MPRKRAAKAEPLERKSTTSTAKFRTTDEASAEIQLLDLPEDILLNILSFISYHEVALLRVVSRRFAAVCEVQLNRGFREILAVSDKLQKDFDSKLPRRKSKRDEHPLANHEFAASDTKSEADKLRLALEDFVEKGKICYFAGKLTDEAVRILRLIKLEQPLADHPFEITMELTDLRVMAQEYFERELEPRLQRKALRPPSSSSSTNSLELDSSENSVTRSSRTSSASLQNRIDVLEDKVQSLENENKKLKDQMEDVDKKWRSRLEDLEKKFCEWTDQMKAVKAGEQTKATEQTEAKGQTKVVEQTEDTKQKEDTDPAKHTKKTMENNQEAPEQKKSEMKAAVADKPDSDPAEGTQSQDDSQVPARSTRPWIRRSLRTAPSTLDATKATPSEKEVNRLQVADSEVTKTSPSVSKATRKSSRSKPNSTPACSQPLNKKPKRTKS